MCSQWQCLLQLYVMLQEKDKTQLQMKKYYATIFENPHTCIRFLHGWKKNISNHVKQKISKKDNYFILKNYINSF